MWTISTIQATSSLCCVCVSLSLSITGFPQGRGAHGDGGGWKRADRTTNNTEREWRTSERPRRERRPSDATVQTAAASSDSRTIRGQTYERTHEQPTERARDSLAPPRFASTRTHLSMSNAHLGGSSAPVRGGARAYGRGYWPPRRARCSVRPIAAAVTSVAAIVACRHQHPPAVT